MPRSSIWFVLLLSVHPFAQQPAPRKGVSDSIKLIWGNAAQSFVALAEAMPEDKEGARRHQWIAFRNYQGQNQQLNIMVSTKGSNFDKQRDTFAAIMYSMKIPKG